jgi:hypothetical protein
VPECAYLSLRLTADSGRWVAIHLAPMANPNHQDNQSLVEHLVEDAVVASPNAIDLILTLKFGTSVWTGYFPPPFSAETCSALLATSKEAV